jgi:type VI secretion system protein ImpK
MPENLALAYQEVFTAIDRLRSGRQAVAEAAAFRQQIRDAIKASEQQSRSLGYPPEEIRLATFAMVAFLDASVLSLQNPVFRDWPKKPLQEELFGSFNAGEIFFTNIQRLSQQNDSSGLADVLEVYLLCLLLGFQGRHSLDGQGELRVVRDTLSQRIRRIRGVQEELSPAWKPFATAKRSLSDPWLKRLLWAGGVSAALALILFLVYKFALHSGISDLAALTGRIS